MSHAAPAYALTPGSQQQETLLLVEDDRLLRMMMSQQLSDLGYEVAEAENGQQACEILRNSPQIDVVILDREMPVMDGMSFIKAIRADEALASKIVIMSTGYGNPEQISEGIAAGVFYYLVKPVNAQVLATVIRSAVDEAQQQRMLAELRKKQNTGLPLLQEGVFTLRLPEEVRHVARLLSQCVARPERVMPGLEALMLNAIEHGNLGIGFALKRQLLETGSYETEIPRRLNLPEYNSRKVSVQMQHLQDRHVFVITDEGSGFDWQAYMTIDPARVSGASGRGILLARQSCFDEMTYNAAGNQVIAVVHDKRS